MTRAAVIQSVADAAGSFADAAPGHRFKLYFPIWRDDWSPDNHSKKDAIKDCTRIPPPVAALLDALRERQQRLFATCPTGLRIAAVSTAPFATGLGNEHPAENGFAFLTPYGLPYLAGSGVKGVLRRTAEELALFSDEYGIAAEAAPTLLDVWWLFGFEGAAGAWWPLSQKEEKLSDEAKAGRDALRNRVRAHCATLADRPDLPAFIGRVIPPGKDRTRYLADPRQFLEGLDDLRRDMQSRGALTFWDVFPRPPKGSLSVEIMTPHFTDYYQNGGTPNDAGQPNPIPFLAIPPEASFDFHVVCAAQDLPEALRQSWKPLVRAVFDHAFDWLGFGAKTAVGYGAMSRSGGSGAAADAGQASAGRRCAWVDATIERLFAERKSNSSQEALRAKALAELWTAIEDPSLKAEARADIQGRWSEKGWWDDPPGKSAKKARELYGD